MSILIGELEFEGPYEDPANIRPEAGLFGILCQIGDEAELIDLDETHCLQDCLATSEHINNMIFYAETCKGTLAAAVHYTPDLTPKERQELKQDLLTMLNVQEEDEEKTHH